MSTKLPRHVYTLLVASPHPISNIRLLKYTHVPDSTPQEIAYFNLDTQTQLFHHAFWLQNNSHYTEQKQLYREKLLQSSSVEPVQAAYSDFYRSYLAETYQTHLEYNHACWGMSFRLVQLWWLAKLSRGVVNVRGLSIRRLFRFNEHSTGKIE